MTPAIWYQLTGECLRNGLDLEQVPFHQLLTVAYSRMVENLPTEDERGNKKDYRGELDKELDVHKWPVPRTIHGSEYQIKREQSTAPAWWVSDEEASQGFLAAYGVVNTR